MAILWPWRKGRLKWKRRDSLSFSASSDTTLYHVWHQRMVTGSGWRMSGGGLFAGYPLTKQEAMRACEIHAMKAKP